MKLDVYQLAQQAGFNHMELQAHREKFDALAALVLDEAILICHNEMDEHRIDSNEWYAARWCRAKSGRSSRDTL